jgi:flavin-dependent dehydrogenase
MMVHVLKGTLQLEGVMKEGKRMIYDLIVIGAGPGGLMAARTAARDGLKVLLVEKRKNISQLRRYCSQLIRVGTGGFSSAKKPTDMEIKSVYVNFEIDYGRHVLHLKNLEDDVNIGYRGMLGPYHNETWVSPSGYSFNSDQSSEQIYGFQIDKEVLLAGLLDESIQTGCEVRSGTKCVDVDETPRGVTIRVSSGSGEEKLQSRRIIIADGAFSSLVEKLGLNEGRPDGGPRLKFLTYILDRVDTPFPESRYMQLCAPSIYPGQINLGLWTRNAFHLGIAAPIFTKMRLPDLLERVMKESPFASWFTSSKVIDRLGCNMALRPAIWEPARGNVICCGDNAAFAETAIKGALGCGYSAAMASKRSLEGGNGNRQYNDFWQHAFYFHSKQYLTFSKEIYPVARVLIDSEVDTLYKWLQDNHLWGLPGDVLSGNVDRLNEDIPEIAEKLIP